jgi:hypothetical protein
MAIAKETVIIGCKLPNGLVLEIGYELNATGAQIKSESYERVVIKGWNAHAEPMRIQLAKAKSDSGVPHGMNTQPFLNRGVPKDFWVKWKESHKRSWLLKNEILFEVAGGDEASAALRVVEGDKTPKIFEPIDRSKVRIPGVTTADFSKVT